MVLIISLNILARASATNNPHAGAKRTAAGLILCIHLRRHLFTHKITRKRLTRGNGVLRLAGQNVAGVVWCLVHHVLRKLLAQVLAHIATETLGTRGLL
ncbi:hypothetical protein BMG523Draft_04675 [Frankia sp. BMG5.23]|nr:hypothetical protein BMG523Draft_04675 [Frankia sp. BMG5.23]